MNSRLLRVSEVAPILGVSVQLTYQMIRDGTLPVVRLGVKRIRIDEQQLREWIANGGRAQAKTRNPGELKV